MRSSYPPVKMMHSVRDLGQIEFANGVAEVDVPIELLDQLPLVGDERPDTERLERLMRDIRKQGYGGEPRIVIQLDGAGRWIVIDGGHRITAARRIAREFWSNLFSRKVTMLHFVIHQHRPERRSP